MSEATIIDHGYIPEEHAPDPVFHHGDPVRARQDRHLALPRQRDHVFRGDARQLRDHPGRVARGVCPACRGAEQGWAGLNTLVLLFSSLTMAMGVDAAQRGDRRKLTRCLAATLLCALGFMCIKGGRVHQQGLSPHDRRQGRSRRRLGVRRPRPLARVARCAGADRADEPVADTADVLLTGYRMPMPSAEAGQHASTFIWSAEADVREKAAELAGVAEDKTPEQQYQSRFGHRHANQLRPVEKHLLRLLFHADRHPRLPRVGGIIPLVLLCLQSARGRIFPAHTEYVGLYWHFVDLIWIFLFPLLYLI